MNTSPQEKEKLRKRLQTLFKKENFKQSGTGKISAVLPQNKGKIKKQKSKNLNDQSGKKGNNLQPNKMNLQNVNKPGQSQKNGPKPQKNVCANSSKKQNFRGTRANSGEFKSKQDEHILSQKKQNVEPKKTNEKTFVQQRIKVENTRKQRDQNNQLENNTSLKAVHKTKGLKDKGSKKLKSSESDTILTSKENCSVANGIKKIEKNRKKKAKKRTSVTRADDIKPTNKKVKLNKNVNKKNDAIVSNSSSSQSGEEYDINNMPGYVRDNVCEEDEMQQEYWLSDGSSSEDEYNSDNQYEENNAMQKYHDNEMSDSGEEYFDSDEQESDFDDYYIDFSGDEEEEENYSDFDEHDYEEDEDSYNYTDSDNDYSSNYDDYENDMSYNFCDNDSDNDYELPKNIPEDLIIHNGTATIRDISPEDNIYFDSDNEEPQIVELENEETVKLIYQHTVTTQKQEPTSNEENCPKLVPIVVDEDGFQKCNIKEEINEEHEPEGSDKKSEGSEEQSIENDDMDEISLGSEYTETHSDDTDSLLSEDINEKYLNKGVEDSSDEIDENTWLKNHKVDIIDATDYKCENKIVESSTDSSDNILNGEDNKTPLTKLYENIDLKTEGNIFTTTIIDDNMLSNDNIDESNETSTKLSSKSIPEPTEDEEEENKTEQRSTVGTFVGQKNGGYNTYFFNAFHSNLVMVLLRDPFYIYGTVRLTLLAGAVEVYGHTLSLKKEVEIFSPRGCSMIEISSRKRNSHIIKAELKHMLQSYENQFALADLKRIVNSYNKETDALILLKRNESRKKIVQQFKKFMNENVFPNINNIDIDRPLYQSEYLLRCMISTYAPNQKRLRLPQQWQEISITSNSCVLLAGGKSVGKSTLLRYLINRHLPQQILLIDLDIGQPEVFVPQTISCTLIKQPLLGPGFFLNLQPEISYAVGHSNITLCVHKYIKAVRSLVTHCKSQEKYKGIPWIINTMGYNKGFGLELISAIAQELPLTDVIQLQSTKEINNFDSILHDHVLSSVPHIFLPQEHDTTEKLHYRLHVWQSAVEQQSSYQKEWEMSAKDYRFAILLTRLSDALQGNADWLTDIKPLSASLNEIKIINLMDNTPSASEEDLAKSIEANLVYLCHYEEDGVPLKCLGIGVVRALDFHVRQLYLIPSFPHNLLKDVNCVAIGEMPLPTSLFTNQGNRVKNLAPYIYNTIAADASKAIKQIYYRPPKFLTGKRKSLD